MSRPEETTHGRNHRTRGPRRRRPLDPDHTRTLLGIGRGRGDGPRTKRGRAAPLLAEVGGDLAGLLTYEISGASLEVVTLDAARPWRGAGTALLDAVRGVARSHGCRRVWLVTTNDNLDALRFYQRRGFRLATVRRDAVRAARQSPSTARTRYRFATSWC